ncbi:MAG: 50S ribosomal protein L9 [bacterium]
MKVILLCDVKKQGKKDDIIEVSDGYGKNFLIKNNLAVAYTKRSGEILNISQDKAKEKEDALIEKMTKIKNKMQNKTLRFEVTTGKMDKVFGSISTKQIVEEFKKQGEEIDKKNVKIINPLTTLGVHEVEINLHKKVIFKIKVELYNRRSNG